MEQADFRPRLLHESGVHEFFVCCSAQSNGVSVVQVFNYGTLFKFLTYISQFEDM